MQSGGGHMEPTPTDTLGWDTVTSEARILLIEDDQETANEILSALASRGYLLTHQTNGKSGLDTARAGGFDTLIVDRMLPELDGLSIIEALRDEAIRTPVLVVSALGDVDERVRGLKSGGDDYLVKPFALTELAARIEALLRRPVETRETKLRVGPLELDLI